MLLHEYINSSVQKWVQLLSKIGRNGTPSKVDPSRVND